jgi:hypothetical protein
MAASPAAAPAPARGVPALLPLPLPASHMPCPQLCGHSAPVAGAEYASMGLCGSAVGADSHPRGVTGADTGCGGGSRRPCRRRRSTAAAVARCRVAGGLLMLNLACTAWGRREASSPPVVVSSIKEGRRRVAPRGRSSVSAAAAAAAAAAGCVRAACRCPQPHVVAGSRAWKLAVRCSLPSWYCAQSISRMPRCSGTLCLAPRRSARWRGRE